MEARLESLYTYILTDAKQLRFRDEDARNLAADGCLKVWQMLQEDAAANTPHKDSWYRLAAKRRMIDQVRTEAVYKSHAPYEGDRPIGNRGTWFDASPLMADTPSDALSVIQCQGLMTYAKKAGPRFVRVVRMLAMNAMGWSIPDAGMEVYGPKWKSRYRHDRERVMPTLRALPILVPEELEQAA